MFDSMIFVGIAASSFAAKRQGVLAQVSQGGQTDLSTLIVLVVVIWAAVNIFKYWWNSQRERAELDRDSAKHERHAFRDDERLTRATAENERLRAELDRARHMIAIMRQADYVPTAQVPEDIPDPDEVFAATATTPANAPAAANQNPKMAGIADAVVAEPFELDDDVIAAHAFGDDAAPTRG